MQDVERPQGSSSATAAPGETRRRRLSEAELHVEATVNTDQRSGLTPQTPQRLLEAAGANHKFAASRGSSGNICCGAGGDRTHGRRIMRAPDTDYGGLYQQLCPQPLPRQLPQAPVAGSNSHQIGYQTRQAGRAVDRAVDMAQCPPTAISVGLIPTFAAIASSVCCARGSPCAVGFRTLPGRGSLELRLSPSPAPGRSLAPPLRGLSDWDNARPRRASRPPRGGLATAAHPLSTPATVRDH